jgi:predicted HAD superfamily hydrolase
MLINDIKHISKDVIAYIFGKSICKQEYKQFDNRVVSFDVFDTLVVRKCGNPHNVLNIVENQYSKCQNNESIRDFKILRMAAEKELRANKNGEEVRLDEIYETLEKRLGTQTANKLKVLEINTELSVCYPNKEVVDLYHYLINRGNRVFIISDMYMPKEVIQKILGNCGIIGYEKLYVSSENGMTKRSGKLFNFVLNENEIDRNKIIHIGDHPIADYYIPKKMGVEAFLYNRNRKCTHF